MYADRWTRVLWLAAFRDAGLSSVADAGWDVYGLCTFARNQLKFCG